ncbi:MAG TPA: FHA domain-containing protein [Solirubrobacteraceae bacterium]|nr:FHA domain-containing protein [Solirubrobacteraceae bacterium]
MTEPHETRLIRPRHLKAVIEAEATGVPFLHWLDADGEQHILLLTEDRRRVTVGRRPHCDVALGWDHEVSREHALLEPVGEAWTLVDDGLSRNGSFVNGTQIRGRHRLSDRDRLCFGVTHVTYRESSRSEGSESTARPPGAAGQIPLTEIQRKLLVALCRPIIESSSTTPATNPQIAAEVHLSVDAVKAHMRDLFVRFGLGELPQNEKRNRLVVAVLASGLVAPHDF